MAHGKVKDSITPAMRQKIVDLWNDGISMKSIASRFGVGQQHVADVLHQKGITTGRRKEWFGK